MEAALPDLSHFLHLFPHIHLVYRIIYALPQLLSGLEVWRVLCRNLYGLTGFRVPPDAGWTVVQTETTKTTNFDAIAFLEALGDRLEKHRNNGLGVFRGKLRELLGQPRNKF